MMKVSNLLNSKSPDVFCIELGNVASEASKCMAYHYIGALLVIDHDGALQGIITERDLAYALHKFGASACDIQIDELMSENVISCASDTSIAKAVEIMLENEIRHLPIKDGELLKGVISMRDIMGDRLVELELENETLRDLIAAEAA